MTTIHCVARWVAEYDSQGWHRSGSRTDTRSARWLADAAGRTGTPVRLEPFSFDRLVLRRCRLVIGNSALPGVPLFDAGLTPEQGITGTLGPLGSRSAIEVVEQENPHWRAELERARREAAPRAIVLLGPFGEDGLSLLNAPEAERPYGPSVIQISGAHATPIRRAVDRQESGSLRVEAHRRAARAFNVERCPGEASGHGARVTVLTPRSGWWNCAAERGGGIACWLETMAALATSPSGPHVSFLATSGHEVGHLGLRHHLAAGPVSGEMVWVHLGANIGAAGGEIRVAASDQRLASLARNTFATAGAPPNGLLATPVGEALDLQARSLPYLSLVGGPNSRFHRLSDRYPQNLDLPALAAVTDAVARIVTELAS